MAKITIFGLAGTGTTTLGKLLALRLNSKFVSTGNIFRQMATDLGLSLYEFDVLCNSNSEYDRRIDAETEKFGIENDNFVLESRLGWHFIPDSFRVKILCEDKVRFGRVAARDGISQEQAKEKTLKREADGPQRYRELYGIEDFGADSHFDFIIDSTNLSPAEIVERIIEAIKSKNTV